MLLAICTTQVKKRVKKKGGGGSESGPSKYVRTERNASIQSLVPRPVRAI